MKKEYYTQDINIDSTHILLKSDVKINLNDYITKQRHIIEDEINKNPQFNGYHKVPLIIKPRILEIMTKASIISGIGPMSSVAGSISQVCLEYLNKFNSKYAIIENGGDIALKTDENVILAVYAGDSVFSNNIGLKVKAKKEGYGICTSSGTVGPSESFGQSDATIVFADEASVADSLATEIGNYANGMDDEDIVNNALERAEEFSDYCDGVIVIKGEHLAKTGHIPKIVTIK